MKKYLLLVALAISGAGFAAGPTQPARVKITSRCEPGFCLLSAQAGNELAQGLRSVERQARRVLEPNQATTLAEAAE